MKLTIVVIYCIIIKVLIFLWNFPFLCKLILLYAFVRIYTSILVF